MAKKGLIGLMKQFLAFSINKSAKQMKTMGIGVAVANTLPMPKLVDLP